MRVGPEPRLGRRQWDSTGPGIRCYPVAACARFVVDRAIPLRRIYTHRFRLEQAEEAYKLFDTQTTGKAAFVFD